MQISVALLRRLWPNAPQALLAAVASSSAAVFEKYNLGTTLRVAHFMAQISEETGGGGSETAGENLSYITAARIAAVWPSRFTVESAAPFVRNPRLLADTVYGGRMGNRPGTEDGYTYRGRGLLQLTGRSSYAEIGAKCGLDLVGSPDLAADPATALEVAACEFVSLNCLPACDADDITTVTRRVNGGYTGLAERKMWLSRWKGALASDVPAPTPAPRPIPAPAPAPQPPPAAQTNWLFNLILAIIRAIFGRK